MAHEMNHLAPSGRIVFVETAAHQHLFAVKSPSLREYAVVVHPANEVRIVVRDGKLQEMTGNSFVCEDREHGLTGLRREEPSILGIVVGNEVEAGVVGIKRTGRIHEAAGVDRSQRRRNLDDLERPKVRGQRDEVTRGYECAQPSGLGFVVR